MSRHAAHRHVKKRTLGRAAPPRDGMSALLIKNACLGLGVSILTLLLLLLLGAALCTILPNPHGAILPMALGILLLSALVAGLFTHRLHPASFLLCGLLSGGGLAILLSLFALFIPQAGSLPPLFATILRFLTVPAACLGAYLGRHQGSPRRRRR